MITCYPEPLDTAGGITYSLMLKMGACLKFTLRVSVRYPGHIGAGRLRPPSPDTHTRQIASAVE
jgi:hypothetical protein